MKKLIHSVSLAAALFAGCEVKDHEMKHDKPKARKEIVTEEAVLTEDVQEKVSECLEFDKPTLSLEEQKLEDLRQKSFYEKYVKWQEESEELKDSEYLLKGDRLYLNEELLCPDFKPERMWRFEAKDRFLHYFLRNGREKTFEAAEKLGGKHRETILDANHPMTKLFTDAGIEIEGEVINWLEIPGGRSGGMGREAKLWGGERDEIIMVVESLSNETHEWTVSPAAAVGYSVNINKEHESMVANEMSHEIQFTYFPELFPDNDEEILTGPFKSFESEVPGLKFKHNAQAGEFLSDVADWTVGGAYGSYFRFFNPLFYMDGKASYWNDKRKYEEDRYWYSYQVQKYAMVKVLEEKGYENAEEIVEEIIEFMGSESNSLSDFEEKDKYYANIKEYFTEEDFGKIAEIYRRIGVELLTEMAPYFEN